MSVLTTAHSLVSCGLFHFIVVLSLQVKGVNVDLLGFALLDQRLILRFSLFLISSGINAHDGNLLLCIDKHFLSCSFSNVNVIYNVSLDLINCHCFLTFGFGDLNTCSFLSFHELNFHHCVGLDLILLLVNLCSFNVLSQLIERTFILSLHLCQLLLLFVFNLQLKVFLLFYMVFVVKVNVNLLV